MIDVGRGKPLQQGLGFHNGLWHRGRHGLGDRNRRGDKRGNHPFGRGDGKLCRRKGIRGCSGLGHDRRGNRNLRGRGGLGHGQYAWSLRGDQLRGTSFCGLEHGLGKDQVEDEARRVRENALLYPGGGLAQNNPRRRAIAEALDGNAVDHHRSRFQRAGRRPGIHTHEEFPRLGTGCVFHPVTGSRVELKHDAGVRRVVADPDGNDFRRMRRGGREQPGAQRRRHTRQDSAPHRQLHRATPRPA